jgi:hypothetical protein
VRTSAGSTRRGRRSRPVSGIVQGLVAAVIPDTPWHSGQHQSGKDARLPSMSGAAAACIGRSVCACAGSTRRGRRSRPVSGIVRVLVATVISDTPLHSGQHQPGKDARLASMNGAAAAGIGRSIGSCAGSTRRGRRSRPVSGVVRVLVAAVIAATPIPAIPLRSGRHRPRKDAFSTACGGARLLPCAAGSANRPLPLRRHA